MKYISVAETAKKVGRFQRSVQYCAEGKIDGAFLTGKTSYTETAEKPDRMNQENRYKDHNEVLKASGEAARRLFIINQIDLTYNFPTTWRGSRLTRSGAYIFGN